MPFDRLIDNIKAKNNPTVAGLDPKLSYLPAYLKENAYRNYGKTLEGAAAAILEYNKGLIDALCDIVPAVKPQCAYYEMYGWQGMRTLAQTIQYAKEKGMYVVEEAACSAFGADALTVNGYLGSDGITPVLKVCKAMDKGMFVLVKTSNPSSGELQNQLISSEDTVYYTMGMMCEQWGRELMGAYGYSGVGAVVGATYPAQLQELREALPHTFFLVPGYGAQGGGARDVAPAFDQNGLGAIINSSRGILCAWQKEGCDERDYAGAARREAIRMRDEIVGCIQAG